MLIIKRKFIKVGECWFDEIPNKQLVDLVEYMQRPEVIPERPSVPFHTIVVDLGAEPESILNQIKKDTRYEIRRAESKDNLTFEWLTGPDEQVVESFCDFYDAFAATKSLEKIIRSRVRLYASAQMLRLSRIISESGEDLVWHCYLSTHARSRLLYSASLFRESSESATRSLVGRANRYLHWKDMLQLKSDGVLIYDFGGWYAGEDDQAKLLINKFKEEFGGQVVKEYHTSEPVSPKGTLFDSAKRLKRRMR